MTVFSKIAAGEIPSYKIAESADYYAFLDINPLAKGHTLVVPRKTENDYLFALDEHTYNGLMLFSKRVAAALEKTVPCKRIGMMVLGMEVPHTHIHLVPLQKEGDMNLSNRKLQLPPDEMQAIAQAIAAKFE